MDVAERIARVVPRARRFLSADGPGHLLVQVVVPQEWLPGPGLWDLSLPKDLPCWMDLLLARARLNWEARTGIDDDTIPSVCPRFGIAEHSAFLGMEVRLQQDTCLPTPLIHDPSDLDRLRLDERAPWFELMERGYEYLRSRQDGSFILSHRGAMAPMDLANAVRGDELYVDVIEQPAFVHRLMDFCTRAEHWWQQRLLAWSDPVGDGRVFMYGSQWLGPDFLGHLSNDAAMLCGPGVYEEFGFPYERRLAADYGGVIYHVHNEKMHYVPRLAQLPGLKLLEVTRDPRTPPVLEDLPRILAATGSANLMLDGSSDQVRRRLGELRGRNVHLTVHCRDRADAQDIVTMVRAASR